MTSVLYRLYDQEEALLYVGITSNLDARFASHASRSAWWPEVWRRQYEYFESWRDAVLAESRAIRLEAPAHNVRTGVARHIMDDISDAIVAGELPAGGKLPSTRELAERYGCGSSVVRQAVGLLTGAGWLYGHQGLGVFVAESKSNP